MFNWPQSERGLDAANGAEDGADEGWPLRLGRGVGKVLGVQLGTASIRLAAVGSAPGAIDGMDDYAGEGSLLRLGPFVGMSLCAQPRDCYGRVSWDERSRAR